LSLPLSKAVLQELAESRVAEAELLLTAGHFSGAYYLGGYAVELALKACIADAFQARTIPERRFVERVHTHDLLRLVELAGLETERSRRSASDSVFSQHWRALAQWSQAARYDIVGAVEANSLVAALSDRDHGVFGWIRAHW
jgi:hypothetical protein